MGRTRCPLCSRDLTASDVRPLGVVFRCPRCDGDLKVVSPIPRFVPMVAYLGWVGAFAMWGFVSFLALIPLAFIATLISMVIMSWFLTTIGGVSLDPVSERGTLPLGETRAVDEERFRSDKDDTEKPVRRGWVISEAIVEKAIVVAIASFFFAVDWSGFDKWQPDLFFPKRFRDVWWHFPIILALVFCAVRFLNRKGHSDEA